MFSNKNGCACIKKLVKTLMEFFQKFSILTENLVDFDVTCSVILGTVPHLTRTLLWKNYRRCISMEVNTYLVRRVVSRIWNAFLGVDFYLGKEFMVRGWNRDRKYFLLSKGCSYLLVSKNFEGSLRALPYGLLWATEAPGKMESKLSRRLRLQNDFGSIVGGTSNS